MADLSQAKHLVETEIEGQSKTTGIDRDKIKLALMERWINDLTYQQAVELEESLYPLPRKEVENA